MLFKQFQNDLEAKTMPLDLSHLNPEQREAAEHFERPLLVLAGAGSGKTRVLTHRIAYLIEEMGVDPASILALTFTNKAAGEMRDRVRALLGREPSGMWIGTFHAIGARILRRHATRLGWTPSFLIYDAADAESLVRRIVKDDLNLDPKRWNPRAVHGAISAAKNELTGVQEYQETALDPFQRTVGQVYERYQRALRDANAFDFDDLLVKPVELLRAFPDVLGHYRDRFQFVLVDEYQDTNRAQYVFLRLLAEEHGNLFVVGDDDQSIYGWRGADIRNILDFEKDFPDAKTIRLEQNYRSSRTILDAANRVIAENVRRKGKTLRTENPEGERLTLVETADEADEAEWIVAEMQARMADNPELGPRHFVVLYRTNAQSRPLEEALIREGIPYRVVGGTRFYERREVKDAMAYLRLVANPAADDAFLRIVNVPRRGVGDTSVARLAEWASEQRVTLLQAAARAEQAPGLRGAAATALADLAGLIQKHAAMAEHAIPLDELLRQLVVEAGLVQALRDEGSDGEERIANLDELIAGAAELQARVDTGDPDLLIELEVDEEATPPRALDLFLSHVALVADIDQHDPTADAVSLMTLHNAKGLEFPFVFVSGMEEGLFPLSRSYDEPEQLEEERRLFYVGITRAERKLYLAYARRRRRGAEWLDSVPSSFLEAIPPGLVETRRTPRVMERLAPYRPWRSQGAGAGMRTRRDRLGFGDFGELGFAASRTGPKKAAASDDDSYQVDYSDSQDAPRLVKGARVRHPQFGAGTVAELSGVGADVRATIDFDSVGRKKVVLRYANLEPEWD
ncbi:MAG TPA: UvrD-helicase domain-containing protein [Longimicrobiaceae bacterium]|nr:UvrD-helicase domain-containing protein [Longimicrobiaceae bacterium]